MLFSMYSLLSTFNCRFKRVGARIKNLEHSKEGDKGVL